MADAMAAQRVEIGVISFGPVRVHSDFQSPDTWTPPRLHASGDTPMGAAIEQGLQMLDAPQASLSPERDHLLSSLGLPNNGWRTHR